MGKYGRVAALVLACLFPAGCEREARVLQPDEKGIGGAGEVGDMAEAVTEVGSPVMPGEIVQRGVVEGWMRYMGPQSVVMDDPDGHRIYVSISPATTLTAHGGQATSLLALESGAALRLWFVNENDRLWATRIEVLERPPRSPGATPSLP